MSMRGAVAGCVVLACLVVLLAERTEGHITFFSPKELMEMKEQEDRKHKTPRSDEATTLPPTDQPIPPVGDSGDSDLGFAFHLPPGQPGHMTPVLGIIQ